MKLIIFLEVIILTLMWSGGTCRVYSGEFRRKVSPQSLLLPSTVRPLSYRLEIRPIFYPPGDPLEFTAPGRVVIQVECLEKSGEIVLHKHPTLRVLPESIQVTNADGKVMNPVLTINYEDLTHFYTITLTENLRPHQQYHISLQFVAPISNTLSGLYRVQYEDGATKEFRRMVMTQFEEYGAREVFPCFDEPRYKTPFRVSIARRIGPDWKYISLSNAAYEEEGATDPELPPGWVWDHYKETVPMPTYLLALIVTDFSYQEAPPNLFNKPVRIYAPGELVKKRYLEFAAEATAKFMAFYEKEFAIPYDLAKIDSLAVPKSYIDGAMENWGLVTYSEELLLLKPGETSEEEKQRIVSYLAHELAHNWFGNLVTCKYWPYMWLNEGLATYVAAYAMKSVFPEFQEDHEFFWSTVTKAKSFDVGVNQSVVNQEDFPENKYSSLDTIVYDKGAALMRMLEGILGRQTLLNGLVAYLKKFAYSSVVQDDLFEVLTLQGLREGKLRSNLTIKEIMDTWTFQPSYPLIRVSRVSDTHLNITQELLAPQTSKKKIVAPKPLLQYLEKERLGKWVVPISIASPDKLDFWNYTPKFWLTPREMTLIIRYEPKSHWILLNPDATGYFRVLYDDELTLLIRNQLKTNKKVISGLSRSQLIDDYFHLAYLGQISISKALDMTTFLKGEEDFVVWYTVFTWFQKALFLFSNENICTLRAYLAPLIESALDIISWEQPKLENGTRVIFRAKLIDWACALESFECINKARELLVRWKGNPRRNPISQELRSTMYCPMVAHGGEAAYDFMWGQFRNSKTTSSHKAIIVSALACSKSVATLNKLLENSVNPKSELSAYTGAIMEQVAANPVGRPHLFRFIQAKFDQLNAHAGGVVGFAEVVALLSPFLATGTDKFELEEFIQKKLGDVPDQNVLKSFSKSLKKIDENIVWMRTFYHEMNDWLKNHTY